MKKLLAAALASSCFGVLISPMAIERFQFPRRCQSPSPARKTRPEIEENCALLCPSPQEVVDKMIELAGVKKGDVVFDVGSGDGRIFVIAAAKGAKATGFEIDGDLVERARVKIFARPACRI